MEIQNRIFEFIKEHFEIADDDTDFTCDVHLFDYGFVDSFGAVEIIDFVEKEWGVEISQQDVMLHSMNTINEIAAVVKGKIV